MDNKISMVIGSWGSYNECNDRALGSKWLCLNNYDSWDEIVKELKEEGFKLEGIDEELFVQDIEGLPPRSTSWDYENPKEVFDLLYESGVLIDDYKYKIMSNYLEVECWRTWCTLVKERGDCWDDDIVLYEGYNWYDLGYNLLHECYEIPEYLENYIEYERWGEQLEYDNFYEVSDGILEIR